MSMVTRSKKRKRVYQRKFDHDQARKLYKEGASVYSLARRFNVTTNAVRRVLDPEIRRRMDATTRRYAMQGVCQLCGRDDISNNATVCRDCMPIYYATTVREDTLLCSKCHKWKPDEDFQLTPSKRLHARRKRRYQCRACMNKARQDYRERTKVPCVECGQPRSGPSEMRQNARKGIRDGGLCRECWNNPEIRRRHQAP